MTGSIPPPVPLAYEGQVVVPYINRTFNPNSSNNTFPIPTIWINTAASLAWICVSKPAGVANWLPIGGGSTQVETLTGDTGGAVSPTSGNINVIAGNSTNVCGSSVLIAGNPGASTLELKVTDANSNTFIGQLSGSLTISGSGNVGFGYSSCHSLTSGSTNTGIGYGTLGSTTTGSGNLAIGNSILTNLVTGSYNIALGYDGGVSYTGSESSNICISNAGVASESNTIHIGTQGTGSGQQNTCYIAGIVGNTVANPEFVQINSATGQLGVGSGGSIISWVDVTGTTQSMAVNTGYVADNAGLVTLTLPATAAFGTVVAVAGKGAGGWTVAQNAGQQINCGMHATTSGTGGSVSSTNQFDCIYLLCVTANTEFVMLNSVGNLTLV